MLDRAFAFMGNAEHHLERKATSGAHGLHLLFPGDSRSVRQALKAAMTAFREMPIGPSLSGVVEIVLAEVLNNVVEHAYADHGRGVVEVEVDHGAEGLHFLVRDDGVPMPGGDVPSGEPHDLAVAADDLPEGGFGWFLIRELTEDLRYRRIANRNELTFRIAHDAKVPEG